MTVRLAFSTPVEGGRSLVIVPVVIPLVVVTIMRVETCAGKVEGAVLFVLVPRQHVVADDGLGFEVAAAVEAAGIVDAAGSIVDRGLREGGWSGGVARRDRGGLWAPGVRGRHPQGEGERAAAGDRERARQSETGGTGQRVGRRAEAHRAPAEDLRAGPKLRVHFQADDRLELHRSRILLGVARRLCAGSVLG